MPKSYEYMSNDTVLTLAVVGDQGARKECLIREIMSVDGVSWAEANNTMNIIEDFNKKSLFMPRLPYHIGIFTAVLQCAYLPPVLRLLIKVCFSDHCRVRIHSAIV